MRSAPRQLLAASLTALCMGLALIGCRRQPAVETPEQLAAVQYGRLDGLRQSPNQGLQEELSKLIADGVTPAQLAVRQPEPADNLGACWQKLASPTKTAAILAESEHLFPAGRFAMTPVRLSAAAAFRGKYESERRQMAEVLARSGCAVAVPIDCGFAADLWSIDALRIGARLEACRAAEELSHADPQAALPAVLAMLRYAACLADQWHPTARIEAVAVRAQALQVMQTVVEHRKSTPQEFLIFLQAIESQLASWPADARAWIGQRALGLHTYELVRDGQWSALMSRQEARQAAGDEDLSKLADTVRNNVDADELYYLQTMRKVVDSCRQPYFVRAALFQAIREELREKQRTFTYPTVAGRFLLIDMERGHILQARDRAQCEVWALALAALAQRKPPAYHTNPLTGKHYQVTQSKTAVVIRNAAAGEEDDDPLVVEIHR